MHYISQFKEIAIAYQTLSDPVLRRKYNEFGPKESAPEGGYVDPEEIFGTIFGKYTGQIGHFAYPLQVERNSYPSLGTYRWLEI